MPDKVTWSEIHRLAKKIDDTARRLGVPDYDGLTDPPDSVFRLEGVVTKSLAYHFDITLGTVSITDHWAATTPNTTGKLTLDEPLSKLAEDGELYYVAEADSCWCRTIFKVTKDGEKYQFAVVDDDDALGCCQTIDIPTSALDYSQVVIPAGWAAYYAEGVTQPRNHDPLWLARPKCTANASGIYFRLTYSHGDNIFQMSGAQRSMTGYFTWKIKASYMNELIEAMGFITQLNHKGGLVQPGFTDEGYALMIGISIGCHFTMTDLITTLVKQEGTLVKGPGCIINEVEQEGNGAYPIYTLCRPWNEKCCDSKQCGADAEGAGAGWLVYKKTIDDLDILIDSIENYGKYIPDAACCPLETERAHWEYSDFEHEDSRGLDPVTGFLHNFSRRFELPSMSSRCPGLSASGQLKVFLSCDGFANVNAGDFVSPAIFCPFGCLILVGEDPVVDVYAGVYPGSPGFFACSVAGYYTENPSP